MSRFFVFTIQTLAAAAIAFAFVVWLHPAINFNPAAASPIPASSMPSAHWSLRGAVRAAMPSVVNIYTSKQLQREWGAFSPLRNDYGEGVPQQVTNLGSGVIWRDDGYVVTNNHVIEGADEIAVVVSDRAPQRATVVGTDPDSDIAVLRVEAQNLPVIVRGDSKALQIGDIVLAIGNPFGVGQTVTQGIVSATGRSNLGINTLENYIQTDAAINPGNSGGALVDASGRLVGINSAIFSESQGSVGIGFAIPEDLVETVAQELIAGGNVRRGWLGLQTLDLNAAVAQALNLDAARGPLVRSVAVGGPAAKAGLRPGDIVLSVDGNAISDSQQLIALAATAKPGASVRVGIDRLGRNLTFSVVLGQRPSLRNVRTE